MGAVEVADCSPSVFCVRFAAAGVVAPKAKGPIYGNATENLAHSQRVKYTIPANETIISCQHNATFSEEWATYKKNDH